jgi:ABC-type nitrate/sulfonate/bicarbonate transport system substrate-binding protein
LRPRWRLALADDAPAPAAPLRVALISEGLMTWPLYVAQAKRLFEREGVAVELTLTGSSVRQLERLVAGGFDIGIQQADHVVRAVERGSDLFIFMAHAHAPDLSLVAAPGVRACADLRGRVVAVDGARTGYALLLRKLLATHGVREGEVEFREFGGSQQRFDALKAGAASASLLNPPFDRNLFAAGFENLGAVDALFPGYPGSIAAARRSWAARHARELIAFIRACHAGYAWLQQARHRDEAVALLPPRLGVAPQAAARAFGRYAQRPLPAIDERGLRQVIDVVWEAEGLPAPRGEPARYLDLSYLERASSPPPISIR